MMAREDTKNRDNAINCIDEMLSRIEKLEEENEKLSKKLEERDKEIELLKNFLAA